MQFLAVNWLAVLVAAIVNMVVGFLWYGPLFSGLFLRLIGKCEEEIEGSPVGLGLLFSSYQLVVLTIAGVLFAVNPGVPARAARAHAAWSGFRAKACQGTVELTSMVHLDTWVK